MKIYWFILAWVIVFGNYVSDEGSSMFMEVRYLRIKELIYLWL